MPLRRNADKGIVPSRPAWSERADIVLTPTTGPAGRRQASHIPPPPPVDDRPIITKNWPRHRERCPWPVARGLHNLAEDSEAAPWRFSALAGVEHATLTEVLNH
jgi:hypothetical protein